MSAFIIILVGFCMNALTVGTMKSSGVFFIQYEMDLNASAAQASLVASFLYGAVFLCGPIASIFANRLGYRRTTVLGATLASSAAIFCSFSQSITTVQIASIITGFGFGLVNVPNLALLGIRFKEQRSFVNNVVTSGSALSAIVLSPLVQLWIDSYGWRGAYLLLGGLCLNILPCCILMSFRAKGEIKPTKGKLLDIDLLKSIAFPAYVIACGCDLSAVICINIYLVRFAQSMSIDNYAAAALASLIAIMDLIFRPISGYITTLTHIGPIPIGRPYYYCVIMCLRGIVVFMFPLTYNIYTTSAVTVAFAICLGSRGALTITLLSDFFGTDKLVSLIGLRAVAVGVFSALTPPLLGNIVDKTGSYHVVFYVSGALSIISAFLIILVKKIISQKERTKKQLHENVAVVENILESTIDI